MDELLDLAFRWRMSRVGRATRGSCIATAGNIFVTARGSGKIMTGWPKL